MRNLFTRKRTAVLAAGAAVVIGGVTALAYWTSTGTGSGSGSVGTNDGAVTVVGTAATPLFPSTSSTVTFTAGNSGTGDQSISTIHLVSVEAYDTAANALLHGATGLVAGCGGTNLVTHDFSMPDVVVNPATDGDILHGATAQVIAATGTLTMNDLSSNQNACKGKFLALTLTTS